MNPIKKFAYASTDIFLLDGTPYTGYYNIMLVNMYKQLNYKIIQTSRML